MQWPDWLILFTYLGIVTGIGVYFSRRQTSLNEFFKSSGNIGWLALGVSLMAALNSGLDYINTPALVFTFGFAYVAQIFTWIPIYFWVTRITLPFYSKLDFNSPYEYLERRFGIGVRLIAAMIYVFWRVSWMSVALYVPCLAVKAATGGQTDIKWLVILTGTTVTIYTMLGGIKAVIWTDITQFCVMFGGLFATLALIVRKVPGGITEVFKEATDAKKLSFVAQIPGWSEASFLGKANLYFTTEVTFFGVFACVLVGRLAGFTSDQVAIQRFQTTKSYSEARNAYVINAVTDAIWMIVLGFVGLALFAYFRHTPFPPNMQNDRVLPYFMSQAFPVGVMGLVIASIFAASLSSVGAVLNSTTSIIVVDFYNRLWRPREQSHKNLTVDNQRRQVFVSRVVTVLLGMLVILIAANVERMGELYTVTNKLLGAFFGTLGGVFILGMFSSRTHSRGVVFAAMSGLMVSCFLSFFSALTGTHELFRALLGPAFVDFCSRLSWQWPPVLGLMVTLSVGYLSSRVVPAPDNASTTLTYQQVMRMDNLRHDQDT